MKRNYDQKMSRWNILITLPIFDLNLFSDHCSFFSFTRPGLGSINCVIMRILQYVTLKFTNIPNEDQKDAQGKTSVGGNSVLLKSSIDFLP